MAADNVLIGTEVFYKTLFVVHIYNTGIFLNRFTTAIP